MISDKDRKRINNNWNYEYVVLELHTFNVGSYVTIKLTNDYNRYKNVSDNGNAILDATILNNILNRDPTKWKTITWIT